MSTESTQNPIVTPRPKEEAEMREDMNEDTNEDTREMMREDMHEETPYLRDKTGSQANERWKRVQAEFVDDPRKSVAEAHKLVSELVERIVADFSDERKQLEGQWSKGGDVSTEDLRVCLQRYRSFFSRLLPSANGRAA